MGFFSKIGKTFKKVFNVVKKIAPIALAVGALIFTGGAALGLAPMAGGWGAAAGSFSSFLGLGGTTAGSLLTGAITQAGYGAVLGGGLGLVTGNDPIKTAGMGALGGAVTGGLMGAAGMPTDPLAGMFKSGTTAPTAAGALQQPTAMAGRAATTAGGAASGGASAPASSVAPAGGVTTGTPITQGVMPPMQASTGLMGFADRNPGLTAGLVTGLGKGLMAMGQDDEESTALTISRETRASYPTDPAAYGAGTRAPAAPRRTTMTARNSRYVYEDGRIKLA